MNNAHDMYKIPGITDTNNYIPVIALSFWVTFGTN